MPWAWSAPALVSLSSGARWASLLLAAEHPERVDSSDLLLAPAVPFPPQDPRCLGGVSSSTLPLVHPDDIGWHKYNRHAWLAPTIAVFVEYFFAQMFNAAALHQAD